MPTIEQLKNLKILYLENIVEIGGDGPQIGSLNSLKHLHILFDSCMTNYLPNPMFFDHKPMLYLKKIVLQGLHTRVNQIICIGKK